MGRKKSSYLLKKNLQKINSFYFFFVLVSTGTIFLVKRPSVISFLFFLYVLIRLFFTRHQLLIRISCLVMVFFIVLCGYSNLREEHISLLLEENVVGKLIILPDTLKIDGDQLKGESVFQLPNQKNKKWCYFINLKQKKRRSNG